MSSPSNWCTVHATYILTGGCIAVDTNFRHRRFCFTGQKRYGVQDIELRECGSTVLGHLSKV